MSISERAALCATALAVILSASCVESAPAGPTMALVPEGAVAAVVMESPCKLYAAAEGFWEASGLDKSSGTDLRGLLEKSFSASGESFEELDFARPWVLAVLPVPASDRGSAEPVASGGKRTRTCLYVPYRSSPERLIEKVLGGSSFVPVAKAKGYIVLSDSGAKLSFPPAKGANLSRLTRYSAASIKLWADPAALRRATDSGFKPVAEAARRFVTDPSASADPASIARNMGELGVSFLSQLELADASLEPGSSGLVVRVGASSVRGSDLGALLAAASRAPSALDWASRVDSRALFGASWSVEGEAGSEAYRRLAGGLFAALGMPPEAVAAASAVRDKWLAALRPRGAMSLDLDLDAAASARAGRSPSAQSASAEPTAASELFARALRFRFEFVQELRDQAACRALLRGLSSDPDFLALSKAYGDATGVSFSLVGRDMKAGSFPYGQIDVGLGISDEGKLRSRGSGVPAETLGAALEAMEPQLTTRWAISQGRLAVTNGDVSALKALSGRSAAKENLASQGAFAAFAKTMPPRPVFVGSFSMRRLMELARSAAKADVGAQSGDAPAAGPGGSGASKLDPALFGSWYSYLAVDSRGGAPGLELGFFVPSSDLKALFGAGAGNLNRKKNQDGGA
jgi:hypothetical protein